MSAVRWSTVYRLGVRWPRKCWRWKAGLAESALGPKSLHGRRVVEGAARTKRGAGRALAKAVSL